MKWLFLIYHLQTQNSSERVRVWRLVKKIGAVLYRNSVYVLPYSEERLEDFQWLCQQIKDSKGEASIFVSESRDETENQILLSLFERSREEEYSAVLRSAEELLERIRIEKEKQKPSELLLKKFIREAKQLDDSFNEVERVDFFSVPFANEVRTLLELIRNHLSFTEMKQKSLAPAKNYSRKAFRRKVWATREHIHIDRLCSAWLILRFIDPQAKFLFAPESKLPKGAIPYDTFGAEFSHHGDDCTFETLLKSFQLKDKSLAAIAEIVHDIDMKDNKFGRPESEGLNAVVRALSAFLKDDHKVVEIGSTILDALYAYFSTAKQKRK